MTTLDPAAVTAVLESHASSCGHFDTVNAHESKSAPGNGVHCEIWWDRIEAIRSSGLDNTSARATFNIRVLTNMLQEPQDAIDPLLAAAVSALFAACCRNFQLGGEARHVDVLGAHGQPLGARAGYLDKDKRLYRVFTILVPVIFNDVWEQVA